MTPADRTALIRAEQGYPPDGEDGADLADRVSALKGISDVSGVIVTLLGWRREIATDDVLLILSAAPEDLDLVQSQSWCAGVVAGPGTAS